MTNERSVWAVVLVAGTAAAVAAGYWMAHAAGRARGGLGDSRAREGADEGERPV